MKGWGSFISEGRVIDHTLHSIPPPTTRNGDDGRRWLGDGGSGVLHLRGGGEGGTSAPAVYPPCEGLATVRGPSGTGWDCGPLVRSAPRALLVGRVHLSPPRMGSQSRCLFVCTGHVWTQKKDPWPPQGFPEPMFSARQIFYFPLLLSVALVPSSANQAHGVGLECNVPVRLFCIKRGQSPVKPTEGYFQGVGAISKKKQATGQRHTGGGEV